MPQILKKLTSTLMTFLLIAKASIKNYLLAPN